MNAVLNAIINVRLYDYEHFRENAYILFDTNIVEIGDMAQYQKCLENRSCENVIDARGRLLLPGLINFHTHMYSAFARGFDFHCDSTKFTEILKRVWWRLDQSLTLEDVFTSASAHCQELLRSGVVGVVDHHAGGQIIGSTLAVEKAIHASGMHGLTCFEISDRFDLAKGILENKAMHARTGGPIGLHASMTLSDKTLFDVKHAIGDASIHVHVSESTDDHAHYAETPTQRFKKHGLLEKPSLLAHCVHIDESDAKAIAESQSTVVLCPLSNMNNGVGAFDYRLLESHGIPIVVGTDGLGADVARSWQMLYYVGVSNPEKSGNMNLESLRNHIAKSYQLYETLTGKKLGKFEKGYRFDAFLTDYTWFTPLTDKTIFSHVFYGIYERLAIDSLWIGGNPLIENQRLIDAEAISPEYARNLWKRMEAADETK